MNIKQFKRVTPEAAGIPSEAIERILNFLESEETIEPHGLMIMRHGKVCAEGWWAPYAAGVPHSLFSVTKTYTATAVGIAYTQGLLGLDDKILDYFPEYSHVDEGDYIREMRVRDALTMSSGKPEIRGYTREWRRHFFEIPFNDKPGTKFEYSCEDTHICMAILQKVTGQDLHAYLTTHLFQKIGIDADRIKWAYLPDGSEMGCGGLFAVTEDSLRLMKLYLQGGVWEGERILAADYVEQATRQQIATGNRYDSAPNGSSEKHFVNTGYGFQIWTDEMIGVYCAAGSLGQNAAVVPALDMVIAWNQTTSDNFRFALGNILRILMPAAQSGPLPPNLAACTRLQRRLQSLSLGNPVSLPCPDKLQEISGQRYDIVEGSLTLRDALWDHLAFQGPFLEESEQIPQVDGMEWFALEYVSRDTCMLHFRELGEEAALLIGLDGVRRLNSLVLPRTPIDKVVLDGAWAGHDLFKLNARWIETCYSITISFRFLDNRAEISAERIFGDYQRHPLRQGNAVATCRGVTS